MEVDMLKIAILDLDGTLYPGASSTALLREQITFVLRALGDRGSERRRAVVSFLL
jgi:hypothetical protein